MSSGRAKNLTQQMQALNGAMEYLGTIAATTAKDNGNTAATFTINPGELILIQPDVDTYVLPVAATGTAVTTSNGFKVLADAGQVIHMRETKQYLSCLGVAGNANVKVWKLT